MLTGYVDFPDFPSFPPIFNKANKNHCKVWIRKAPKNEHSTLRIRREETKCIHFFFLAGKTECLFCSLVL